METETNVINGYIYKITDNTNGNCYYGNTDLPLEERLSNHERHYKGWLNEKHSYYTAFEILKNNDYEISLMEELQHIKDYKYPLEVRERFYIENNECVNKNIPTRTKKEYMEAHREHKRLYDIRYRAEHKEQKKLNDKNYYENNKEKCSEVNRLWVINNAEKVKEDKKKYYENNKNKIQAWYKEWDIQYKCECGSNVRKSNKSSHNKTKKHLNHLSLHTPPIDLNLNPSVP